jgi:hypothetical protein
MALSGAERQRRYIERLKAQGDAARHAALEAEIATLKAKLAKAKKRSAKDSRPAMSAQKDDRR